MWSYICYGQVFLVLTHTVQERSSEERKIYSRDERIFSDVIRNISRVNNVLHELIANYKQLQKIYKSEENIEKDYSTDEEIDEIFKTTENDKNKRGRYIKKSRDKSKEVKNFPATQTIWSDDDGTSDDSFEEPKKHIDHKSKSNQSEIKAIETKSISIKKAEIVVENTSDEFKETKEYQIHGTPKKDKKLFINISKEQKNNIIDVSQFANINKRPKLKFTRKISKKSTTKRKIVKKQQYYNDSKFDHVSSKNNITKNIKMIVYSEAFSPKTIWTEIIQNKPIHLKAQEETMYSIKERKDWKNLEPHLRSVDGRTPLPSLIKAKEIEKEESSQSTDDEAKEILKTNVLRHAYGDACLKVVVKKCYKACKLVSKAVCTRNSCKSKLKQKFKESSKTGCIKEFRPAFNNNGTQPNNMRATANFNDATRSGLLEICHSGEEEKPKLRRILKKETKLISTNLVTKFNKELNILRDRYERACRRASAKKCVSACNYASKSTCDTFTCTKGLKKAYRKFCKKQCGIAYVSGHRKSSGESGTSGNTDSSSATSFSHI